MVCPCRYLSLLGLLRLGRMYRIRRLFNHLNYNVAVNLMTSIMMRNSVIVFYLLHWAACGMAFIFRQEGYSNSETWVGNKLNMIFPNGVDLGRL
jgi:hypothetical protein